MSSVFKVSDNYLIHEDEEIRIEGRVLQNENNASSLDARFDDGISVSDSNQKNVIEMPQNTTVIDIGVSKALPLSSNYDTMPNRKLRIVCQYRTYSVEYLLVISANPEME